MDAARSPDARQAGADVTQGFGLPLPWRRNVPDIRVAEVCLEDVPRRGRGRRLPHAALDAVTQAAVRQAAACPVTLVPHG
ncbi:hypothetical protein [Streptomyces sviceus]|uniref:hypothetical protein n=1 Tax=Streptomyces sviceus TaxID=285530 RepID=UPI00332C718F